MDKTMISHKLTDVFSDVFNLDKEQVTGDLAYASIQTWDSVAHMVMVAEVEEIFDIMMDTDDIIEMSTFQKSVEIIERIVVEQNG